MRRLKIHPDAPRTRRRRLPRRPTIIEKTTIIGETTGVFVKEKKMSSVRPISQPNYGLKEKYENYIGGQWVAPTSGEYFEDISPVNG